MNIIITGASKGIGRAIAEQFAADGHHLFLCSRSGKQLYDTVDFLQAAYPQCKVTATIADMGVKQEAQQFAEWVLQFAVPDIIVNNAGNFIPGSVHNEPDGALEEMIAVNLYSAYHVTRALLPGMIKTN